MIHLRIPRQEADALPDIITRHCHGAVIETFNIGKESVFCVRGETQEVWMTIDQHIRGESIDDLLGSIANMLVCCRHCPQRGLWSSLCRREYRMVARKWKSLLGKAGYDEFLAHAPLSKSSAGESVINDS